MGTVSDKLTYLNTTKEKIKENLNYAGCNITDEPFRQYASILKDKFVSIISNPEQEANAIYDSFPKAINTGTHITTNTYNTRFDMDLLGDTSQDGTPTPSSPIPVNVVSGDNEINICGKNLFDKDSVSLNYRIDASGNLYSDNNYFTSNYIKVLPSTRYTYSRIAATGTSSVYAFYDNNKTFISRTFINNSATSVAITTPSNCSYIRIADFNTTIDSDQLEKGSTATTYEAYKGKTYEVNLGKNLFDLSQSTLTTAGSQVLTISGQTLIGNGTPSASNTGLINQYITQQIASLGTAYIWYKLIEGTFAEQIRVNVRDTNNTIVARKSLPTSLTYENGYTYEFIILTKNSTPINNLNFKMGIQLEKGTQATSYSPYFTPIELCKIGTYQDKIKKSTGKNLFDDSVERKSAYPTGDVGQVISYNNSSASYTYVNCCYVEQGKTYKLSWNRNTPSATTGRDSYLVDNENKILGNIVLWNNTDEVSYTPGHSGYLVLCVDKNTTEIMINEGTTALPYEPYGKVWYLHKEIGKVVLDGTQNITLATSGTRRFNATYTTLGITNIKDGTSNTDTSQYRINDHFVYGTMGNWGNYYLYSNWLVLLDTNSAIASASDLATWFNSNKTSIYYVLATPTNTEITNTELINQLDNIELLDGYNEITVNGDLPTILYLKTIPK